MRKIDGQPALKPDPRVQRIELDFREGSGKDGSATIILVDNVPSSLNWYVWDLDHSWMIRQIESRLGTRIRLTNQQGGNGHYSADLEVIK